MLKKLTGLITNNFGLKILGIIFAIALWLVVVNVEDPNKSVTFSIPVDVVNTEYLTDIGKTYEILDDTDTISFTVTGQRSVVETLSASDFKAVANIENIDDSMSMVPIVVTATSYSSQLEITKRNSYLLLNVENSVSDNYEISVVTEGDLTEGCYVASAEAEPQTVNVTGPESVMATIVSAQVLVDVSGATDSLSSTEEIILLDEDSNEVSQDRLTLDETSAVATVNIRMKKEVSLTFSVTGDPEDGYRYNNELESEVESITLVGSWEVLNALDELEISSSQLSVEGATETITTVIHLPDYLPDGVSLASGEEEDITVKIVIEAQTSVEVEVPVSNLTYSGLADGLELSYNNDTVTVTITGFEEDLTDINGKNLTGTLDVSNLEEAGTYNVAVQLDGTYSDNSEAAVSVTITDTSADEETESSASGASGSDEDTADGSNLEE